MAEKRKLSKSDTGSHSSEDSDPDRQLSPKKKPVPGTRKTSESSDDSDVSPNPSLPGRRALNLLSPKKTCSGGGTSAPARRDVTTGMPPKCQAATSPLKVGPGGPRPSSSSSDSNQMDTHAPEAVPPPLDVSLSVQVQVQPALGGGATESLSAEVSVPQPPRSYETSLFIDTTQAPDPRDATAAPPPPDLHDMHRLSMIVAAERGIAHPLGFTSEPGRSAFAFFRKTPAPRPNPVTKCAAEAAAEAQLAKRYEAQLEEENNVVPGNSHGHLMDASQLGSTSLRPGNSNPTPALGVYEDADSPSSGISSESNLSNPLSGISSLSTHTNQPCSSVSTASQTESCSISTVGSQTETPSMHDVADADDPPAPSPEARPSTSSTSGMQILKRLLSNPPVYDKHQRDAVYKGIIATSKGCISGQYGNSTSIVSYPTHPPVTQAAAAAGPSMASMPSVANIPAVVSLSETQPGLLDQPVAAEAAVVAGAAAIPLPYEPLPQRPEPAAAPGPAGSAGSAPPPTGAPGSGAAATPPAAVAPKTRSPKKRLSVSLSVGSRDSSPTGSTPGSGPESE